MSYRTQKATGLDVLRSHTQQTPKFDIFPIEYLEAKLEDTDFVWADLLNKFWRPCPVRPRHGFVDSRFVSTFSEAKKIIRETRTEDDASEIIIMPKVEANYSAIWTTGAFVIGPGNDGATSGRDTLTLPAIGELVSASCRNAANITEAPYLEIVWDSECEEYPYFVQLRNGPVMPSVAGDYIPAEITVQSVLLADGDLLEWEAKIKQAGPGTVVYHPGGSLASHYAVHAVIHGIPVMLTREPKLGETLSQTVETSEPDVAAMRHGFNLGATMLLSEEHSHAVDTMLAACHSTSAWLGKADAALGFGMGMAWRLTVMAGIGELRHRPKGKIAGQTANYSRSSLYNRGWKNALEPDTMKLFVCALRSFGQNKWIEGYGGSSWYRACSWALKMYNALGENDWKKAIACLNGLVNSAHNNGWLFDKFASKSSFDIAALSPVSALLKCGPWYYQALGQKPGAESMLSLPWKSISIPKEKYSDTSEDEDTSEQPDSGTPFFDCKASEIIAAQATVWDDKVHVQIKVSGKPGYQSKTFKTESDTLDTFKKTQEHATSESFGGSGKAYIKLVQCKCGSACGFWKLPDLLEVPGSWQEIKLTEKK